MRHRRTIIELIEVDIVTFKLVKGLGDLGLESSFYMKDVCRLVFKLMGIKKRLRTDELYEKYFKMMREEVNIQDKKELRKLSVKIFEETLKQLDYQ